MAGPSSDVQDLILSVEEEPPYAPVQRVSVVLVVALAAGIIAHLVFEIKLASMFWLGLPLLAITFILAERRCLVLRNNDLYTIAGELNNPIRWDFVTSIDPVDTDVVLTMRAGYKIDLPLTFLEITMRKQAIERMVHAFDLYQHRGPLCLPDPDVLTGEDGVVRLRRWGPEHRELGIALNLSPENISVQLSETTTPEMAAAISPSHDASNSLLGWRKFVIESGTDAMGFIMIHVTDPFMRKGEMGVDLLPDYCNHGHGTAAVRILLKFLEAETNLAKVSAGCFSDNIRCRRALEKAGMRHAGTLTKFWFKSGAWKDGEVLELDLEEIRRAAASP